MEAPPIKTFLFLITFLAVFGLLVVTIPSGFLVVSDTYESYEVPEEKFRIDSLESYSATWFCTFNETGGDAGFGTKYSVSLKLGGHTFRFSYTKANMTPLEVIFTHEYTQWWFFQILHRMEWKNKAGLTRGDILSVSELETDYPEYIPYSLTCSHTHLDASFSYDEETYSSVEDAWNHHALEFWIGIEFDALNTGLNAWDLLSMILFFELPNVHPVLNYIIKAPIWFAIGYLAFAFILAVVKALPFT